MFKASNALSLFAVVVLITSCKPVKRNAKSPDLISIDLKDIDLKIEDRAILPVMYCNDATGTQSYLGKTSNKPRKSISFSTKEKRPIVGKPSCYIDVYSKDIEGLKINYPEEKIIEGDQYKVIYQSNIVTGSLNSSTFWFKKLYNVIENDQIVFTLKINTDENSLKGELLFYCKETKPIAGKYGITNNIFEFEFKTSDIFGKPEYLTECTLKNQTSESLVKTNIPERFNYTLSKSFSFNAYYSTSNKSFSTEDVYDRFNGKKFKLEYGGDCLYYLEFKKEGEINYYREYMESAEKCSNAPYDSGLLEYFVFDSNDLLPDLVNERNLLFKFKSTDGEFKYSIIQTTSDGFLKKGGDIRKIELLEMVEGGAIYRFSE